MQHTWSRAVTWGAALTIPLLALLTILGELQPAVKQWLADMFTHHWLGKGILGVAVFILLALLCRMLPARGNPDEALRKATLGLSVLSVVSSVVLVSFFLIEWWF